MAVLLARVVLVDDVALHQFLVQQHELLDILAGQLVLEVHPGLQLLQCLIDLDPVALVGLLHFVPVGVD